MRRAKATIALLGVTLLLLPLAALATTRDVANLQKAALSTPQSVLNELSGNLLWDPYDELQARPFNLPFANIGRHGNLSPWPGQQGEQSRYFNALIGNNGNTNVRNGSDVLQGTFIRQPGESLSWGASLSYLADDSGTENVIGVSSFGDGQELTGYDLRFALGYRSSDRVSFGGGLNLFDRKDEVTDRSFQQGTGGFFSSTDLEQTGAEIDFGLRRFTGDGTSWEAQIVIGQGDTQLRDFSETLDGAGVVTSRFVATEYEITDVYLRLAGGYNRLYAGQKGELQFRLGYGSSEHELDNTNLSYSESGGSVTTNLELLDQDPVAEDEIFASVGSVRLHGTTQVFSGARLSRSTLEGFTRVDSSGTTVDETIEDELIRLGLTLGLRQPLRGDKLRLIASAHADWSDEELKTITDGNSSGNGFTQTTTRYTVGIEGVFGNIVFDVAWVFGEGTTPLSSLGSRQVIDFDRVVVSATLSR